MCSRDSELRKMAQRERLHLLHGVDGALERWTSRQHRLTRCQPFLVARSNSAESQREAGKMGWEMKAHTASMPR